MSCCGIVTIEGWHLFQTVRILREISSQPHAMKTSTSSAFLRKLFAPLCAAVLPAFLICSANAQTTIAGWDMSGQSNYGTSPLTATTTATNTTVGALTKGSGMLTGGLAATRAWGYGTSTTAANTTNSATAISNNSFFTFTVKANDGFNLSLSAISTFDYRRSGNGAQKGLLQYQIGSGPFVDITTVDFTVSTSSGGQIGSTSLSGIPALQNLPASSLVTFRCVLFTTGGTGGVWYIFDRANSTALDFALTGTVTAAQTGPTINTNGTLTSFSTTAGTASAVQTFSATGSNLSADITITAPADFEVATDGATFGETATITQSGGSASATVSVRIKASATVGAKSGNIVLSSTGATDVNVPVSGTVTAAGTPLVSLSTNSISGLSTSVGVASAATNYVVTGTNLGTTAVTITPSQPFLEVGTNGTSFASTIDLSPTDGAVSNTVFLRVAATNLVTNYSATISHVSGSASNSLAVSGAITNLPPVLTVSTNTLSGFTTTTNVASAAQTFTVTGSNLTTNITIGAPTGFQVANDGTTWGTNTSLTPVSGGVSNTISVRLAATNVAGTPAGNVTVSGGSTNLNVAVSGIVNATANAFTPGNLVVARYGNGSASLTAAAATTVYLELTSSGVTNQILTTLSTAPVLLTDAGSATSVGFLNTYQGLLSLPGYNSAVGTASVANTNTKVANIVGADANVVGRVLFPTNGPTGTPPSPFSGSNFRSVIATGTNTFYASGNSSGTPTTGGVWYYNGESFSQVSTNINNTRVVEIYNGKLYFSAASGTVFGIYQIGTGLPTTTNETTSVLIPMATGSSPYGFAISADGNTAYIADDSAANGNLGGGIQKWTRADELWTRQYTFTNQARGLAVDFSGPNPVIYATTTETSNNKLIKITDSGSNSVVSTIAEAGANFVFRGVDFTPSATAPAPSNLSYSPSSANGVVGTAILSMIPTVTGEVDAYSIDPALPAGLSINPTTGVISGTPSVAAASANYTITASNGGGSTTAQVTIAIQSVYGAWAGSYGLNPTTDGAPSADPDSDGLDNSAEYAFGTNPTVATASLLTTSGTGGNFTVTWLERSGVTYNVQSTVNLATTAFANDGTIEVVNGPSDPAPPSGYTRKQFTVPSANNKFFRIRALVE